MIVDIVELPSRLRSIKRCHEVVASEIPVGLPICALASITGYWEPTDEPWTAIGGVHPVITYRDALFRYKFIEPTKYGLAEYFVMTSSPIDILHPLRTSKVNLVCPWVTLTDTTTLKVRKFILWNGIFELMHYETEDTIIDVPVEAVMINELRTLAKLHDRPDLLEVLSKYPDYKNILISEETVDGDVPLDSLLMLKSNMEAYTSMCVNDEPYYWPDIMDVLRGVTLPNVPLPDSDKFPIRGCTLLSHFIHGPVLMSEIRHLFGMTYDTHAYQRPFNTAPLKDDTELSIYEGEASEKFDVLKYVERLPYSEFELTIERANKTGTIRVFNPYDPFVDVGPVILENDTTKLISKIVDRSLESFPDAEKIVIISSYSDEVYITTLTAGGTKSCSYYDLVSASLGSRNLIRDYNGSF